MAGGFVKATNKAVAPAATSIAIPTPGGISVGNLLWAAVVADNVGGFTTPTGWTQFHHASVITNFVFAVYFKIAEAADVVASNFTWAWSGTDGLMGIMACIAQGDEIEGEQNTLVNNQAIVLLDPPSYTTVKDFSLILRVMAFQFATAKATSLTPPAGVTLQDSVEGAGAADPQLFLYTDDALVTPPGASGAKQFTAVGSTGNQTSRSMTMGIPDFTSGGGGSMGHPMDEQGEAMTKGQKILNPFGTKKRACMCPVGKCRCL